MAAAMDIAALASIWEFTGLVSAMAATATSIVISATMPVAGIIATAAIIMMTIVETAGIIGVSGVITAGRITNLRLPSRTSMLLRTWRSRSLTPILEQRSMTHLSVSRWRAFQSGLAFPALFLSSCARQARRRLGGRAPLRSIAIPAAASA